jgi:hypothetical protein
MTDLQAKADKVFTIKMSSEKAQAIIENLLDNMPNNAIVRIAKIIGEPCPPDNSICWWYLLSNLAAKYTSPQNHKIIWFDAIETCDAADACFAYMTDVIIDLTNKGAQILYKDSVRKDPRSMRYGVYTAIAEDYVPTYEKMLSYFRAHNTLDETLEGIIEGIEKRSVHQLLTPETIEQIRKAQEKKIAPRVLAP